VLNFTDRHPAFALAMPRTAVLAKEEGTMARKKSATTRRAARAPQREPLPRKVYAIASPHSLGGVSMFDAQGQINSDTVTNFFSEEELINRAVTRLQDAKFEVLQVSPSTIHIAGPPSLYNDAFNTKLMVENRPVIKPGAVKDVGQFVDSPDTELNGLVATAGTAFADVLEGVAIEEPRYYMAPPSIFAPTKAYWHLDVPGGVSLGCNADRAHRAGITGKGIKVAMCDSGHFTHPYFAARGYRVSPVVLGPGAANPADDESGHGTGESTNIFAVAPDVQLLPVKMNFANTTAAFNAAVGLGPDIITCSWGSSTNGPLSAADQALAAAIATAVASGIIVVFSAGNGHFGFPGQHPDVISAGGTYMLQDGSMTASDYASGFISQIYPNRRVPDLCGLVGLLPHAIYIMFPLQPGDQIDTGNGGGTFPNGDETAKNDGWAAFSGTSAAAPQLAGAAALVKQACPHLSPAQVRTILMNTARDVTTGHCNPATGGFPAKVGPDTATGNGLVDAEKAALMAKLHCISVRPVLPTPVQPIQPQPVHPQPVHPQSERAVFPVGSVSPVRPVRPVGPIRPVSPIRPIVPILPIRPIRPIVPIVPIRPIEPIDPIAAPRTEAPQQSAAGHPAEHGQQLSPEEVRSLQEMAHRGEIGLGDLEK
jgi:Subtilase family